MKKMEMENLWMHKSKHTSQLQLLLTWRRKRISVSCRYMTNNPIDSSTQRCEHKIIAFIVSLFFPLLYFGVVAYWHHKLEMRSLNLTAHFANLHGRTRRIVWFYDPVNLSYSFFFVPCHQHHSFIFFFFFIAMAKKNCSSHIYKRESHRKALPHNKHTFS